MGKIELKRNFLLTESFFFVVSEKSDDKNQFFGVLHVESKVQKVA